MYTETERLNYTMRWQLLFFSSSFQITLMDIIYNEIYNDLIFFPFKNIMHTFMLLSITQSHHFNYLRHYLIYIYMHVNMHLINQFSSDRQNLSSLQILTITVSKAPRKYFCSFPTVVSMPWSGILGSKVIYFQQLYFYYKIRLD